MFNGIIVQQKSLEKYKGVEGNNWYLNELFPDIDKYFLDNIEKSWYDEDWVDVCADIKFIYNYIRISLNENIDFRILVCDTEKQQPKLNKIPWKLRFLGYDYAYPGGSYYSVIFNDICSERISEFSKFKLNKNGLFETETEIREFIHERELLKQSYEKNMFEGGDFIIFKLYEAVNI